MDSRTSSDFPELNSNASGVWDRIAGWWDDQIGDGNDRQDYLIEPPTERMLALKPGETVLDIACGAGRFARRMAQLGANVVAFDQSAQFIQRARERTAQSGLAIDYRVLDATNVPGLLALGERRYDAAVCTMALMDIASLDPLLSTLPRLLKPRGRFVFSVNHPAFHSGTARNLAEEVTEGTGVTTRFSVAISEYSEPFPYRESGITGQPEQQYIFHRSISMLFQSCFKHGMVLDWMEEPTLPEELASQTRGPFSWAARHQKIPPMLVARMRVF